MAPDCFGLGFKPGYNPSMDDSGNQGAFSPEQVAFLLSPRGRDALTELASEQLDQADPVAQVTRLRRSFSPAETSALLTLARLRERASRKFPQAHRLFFTPEALEQATAHPVALHRAQEIHRRSPPGPVLELGCGIGGDTLALARFRPVIAYERDPVRLALAQANVQALGLADRVTFRQADWVAELAAGRLPPAAAAFGDPSRRRAGRRLFSLHRMEPPLEPFLALAEQLPLLAIKVAPGVQDQELPSQCGVEFVGHQGACKEAVLWFGQGMDGGPRRWASVHTEEGWRRILGDGDGEPPLGELSPSMVLHEPHPAVIRAGAFRELCRRLEAHLFDPQIAYLISPVVRRDPLVHSFRIQEVHAFSLKRLNRRIQALGLGLLELKKRGSALEPESLRPRLKPVLGGRPGVIFFTRQGDRRLMLIGERLPTG